MNNLNLLLCIGLAVAGRHVIFVAIKILKKSYLIENTQIGFQIYTLDQCKLEQKYIAIQHIVKFIDLGWC
jgi:hypothetical protein